MTEQYIRMLIYDALEVKMVRDKDSDELSDVEEFEWNLIKYDENFIQIRISFVNPYDIGTFAT